MREPWWWYGTTSGVWISRALAPAGWIYGRLTASRMRRAPAWQSSLPVVAIGNFTAGGTGKTPFVRVVVAALEAMGHRPLILSRGYGGTASGPHLVDPSGDTSVLVGDEPLLLAKSAPVMVSRDRAAGARAIEAMQGLRATVIVMDDALQNPALHKNLTLALVDGARGFGNGRCIPAGPLRAPLADQMQHVTAVVINGGDPASLRALDQHWQGPVLKATFRPVGDVHWLHTLPVVAYAGIGVPERFFQTLTAQGCDLRQQRAFADHHAFSADDARQLLTAAETLNARLLTTEKDYARLAGGSGALATLRDRSTVLHMEMALDAAGADSLKHLLATHVGPAPHA